MLLLPNARGPPASSPGLLDAPAAYRARPMRRTNRPSAFVGQLTLAGVQVDLNTASNACGTCYHASRPRVKFDPDRRVAPGMGCVQHWPGAMPGSQVPCWATSTWLSSWLLPPPPSQKILSSSTRSLSRHQSQVSWFPKA